MMITKTKPKKIISLKKKNIVKPSLKEKEKKQYFEAVGRRKRAIARVRIWTTPPKESIENDDFIVNGINYKNYFFTAELQNIAESALKRLKSLNRFKVSVIVSGGGIKAQSEAVRHSLARALVKFDVNFRKKLKKAGFLKRDPRKKERKKYGLKKARRAPQWSKR